MKPGEIVGTFTKSTEEENDVGSAVFGEGEGDEEPPAPEFALLGLLVGCEDGSKVVVPTGGSVCCILLGDRDGPRVGDGLGRGDGGVGTIVG